MERNPDGRTRLESMRDLWATLKLTYATIPVNLDAEAWQSGGLVRLGLTPAEIAAVTAENWQAAVYGDQAKTFRGTDTGR